MKTIDYIRTDTIDLHTFWRSSPLFPEAGGLRRLLEIVDRHAGGLLPKEASIGSKSVPFDPDKVETLFSKAAPKTRKRVALARDSYPAVSYLVAFLGGASPVGAYLEMAVASSYFENTPVSEQRGAELFSLALELSRAYSPFYGFAHSKADITLGADPHPSDPFAQYRVYEAFWLNIYGSTMVDEIGRDRVLSVPCYRMEVLPDGGVVWLTRPSPSDFASPEAREAQARALAHLRADLRIDDIRKQLAERSAKLAPVEQNWDADIRDLLELTLDDVRVADRPTQTAKLNAYRPPEVTEWRPASELLPSSVDNVEDTVDRYGSLYAEQVAALLHKDVPAVMQMSPAALPSIDYHFWHFDYPGTFERRDIDNDLVPAVGAYLGEMLVRNLGGRWVPRRDLDESQVVLGDRAWLPFLRAKRYFQSAQAALDYSLTKFYRTAEWHLASLR